MELSYIAGIVVLMAMMSPVDSTSKYPVSILTTSRIMWKLPVYSIETLT